MNVIAASPPLGCRIAATSLPLGCRIAFSFVQG
jgi:hypothetical protein